MIRFLLGEAGTGKTTLLYENLKKSLDSGAKAILLVPEQASFDASCIWGPLMGVKAHIGFRFTLWKKA